MGRLQGQTALITGAARGLGAAIARRFADEGAKVIVNDSSLDAARATAEKLGGFGLAADVADRRRWLPCSPRSKSSYPASTSW